MSRRLRGTLVALVLVAACEDSGSGPAGSHSSADGTSGADSGGATTGTTTGTGEQSCGSGASGWVGTISAAGTELGGLDAILHVDGSLFAFGGRDDSAVGGIYDLSAQTWRPINLEGAPVGVRDASLVWTGDRLLVWGGVTVSGVLDPVRTGGIYDPMTDAWIQMSTDGAPDASRRAFGAWTGDDAIFWGGTQRASGAIPESVYARTGGRYDPSTDAWSPMSDAPLDAETRRGITWTGSALIAADDRMVVRYDPDADEWTTVCALGACHGAAHVWDGAGSIAWSGYETLATDDDPVDRGVRVEGPDCERVETSTTGAPSGRKYHSAVWTGDRMIVFGGITRRGNADGLWPTDDGGSYDPATDSWSPLIPGGTPGRRADHQAIWTGTQMIVWGGEPELGSNAQPAGCIYQP